MSDWAPMDSQINSVYDHLHFATQVQLYKLIDHHGGYCWTQAASLWYAICKMVDFRLLSLKLYSSGSVCKVVTQPRQELASDA